MSPATQLLIEGVIVLGPEVGSFSGAEARVYLEDVSRTDAAARVVAQEVIPNIAHQAGQESTFAFQICGEAVVSDAHYSVRVHIDLQGRAEVQVGDYVSVQSYPVLTFGHPNRVILRVKEVR